MFLFKKKILRAFTLIELLVVVAIIGILAAIGVVSFSGFTDAAKASATKVNHVQITKFILNETKKCQAGAANIMVQENVSLNCQGLVVTSIIDYIKTYTFANLKNIYNPNSNQAYLSRGLRQATSWSASPNWTDSDVGIVDLAEKNPKEIHIRTCFKLPCSNSENRMDNLINID
jgi:type IV pilus assembly protein PilA